MATAMVSLDPRAASKPVTGTVMAGTVMAGTAAPDDS
jgi:hypothetical protein